MVILNATNELVLDLQTRTNFRLLQICSYLGYVKEWRSWVTVQYYSNQRWENLLIVRPIFCWLVIFIAKKSHTKKLTVCLPISIYIADITPPHRQDNHKDNLNTQLSRIGRRKIGAILRSLWCFLQNVLERCITIQRRGISIIISK